MAELAVKALSLKYSFSIELKISATALSRTTIIRPNTYKAYTLLRRYMLYRIVTGCFPPVKVLIPVVDQKTSVGQKSRQINYHKTGE